MINKLKYLAAGLVMLVAACTSSDNSTINYSTLVDLTDTSISGDKLSTTMWFSLDDGETFENFPINLKGGQSYRVKIHDDALGAFLENPKQYVMDWSNSNPQPDDASSTTPSFKFGSNAKLSVKVSCNYSAAYWTGAWGGDEVGSCCGGTDANNVRQSSSDPNTFIMDNFWGDHVDCSFIFAPPTTGSTKTGTVTIPTQTTSEGGVASGTGTYDQCRGTFTIATKYVIGGTTYNWQYNFHR